MLGYGLLAVGVAAVIAASRYMGRQVGTAIEAAVGAFPIESEVELDDNGLNFANRFGTSQVRRVGIQDVQVLPEHVAVILRPYQVSLIPNRAFTGAEERDRFVQEIRNRI